MRRISRLLVSVAMVALVACGDYETTNNTTGPRFSTGGGDALPSGTWAATLNSSTGTAVTNPAMTFTLTMSFGGLNNTSMTGVVEFIQAQNCFGPNPVVTGTLATDEQGARTLTMRIRGLDPTATGENQLDFLGTFNVNMTQVTGSWILTGVTAGCPSDSGTFTMTRQDLTGGTTFGG